MLRGDFWGGSADITIGDGGPAVAQIARNVFNMREVFHDKQTVSFEPGTAIQQCREFDSHCDPVPVIGDDG